MCNLARLLFQQQTFNMLLHPQKSNSRNLTVRNIFANARVLPAKIIMEFIPVHMLAYCVCDCVYAHLIPFQFDDKKQQN